MKFLIFIFLLFPLTVLSQSIDTLKYAYKRNSDKKLISFLDNWNSTIKPNEDSSIYNSELKKDVLEIYKKFYNPFDFNKTGVDKKWDSLYLSVKYVLIQDRIDIIVLNNDSYISWLNLVDFLGILDSVILSKDSIINFRPDINFPNAKTLYLTNGYYKILNNFLKDKHYPLGYGNLMNPARAKGSSFRKVQFINKYLGIIQGHWGGYWYIETHPYVNLVIFNKNRDIAKVEYRLAYRGGEAYFKKEKGNWVFWKGRLTWIE